MAAGDFYFAINATFRFIHDTWGKEALVEYWQSLGREYYASVNARFRRGGLTEVMRYWVDYFAQEPDGEVEVSLEGQVVQVNVRRCPALRWLRDAGREIVPCYCEHCLHVGRAMAEAAGMSFQMEGGNGQCRQRFS